ncbi:MAG: glycosyltransferase [Williamsia sp.]|nr:glycosyltransferase [Williamsia sp.]
MNSNITTTRKPVLNGERKKFLFATFAADGHFHPLTNLATYLASLGHDVRWYTSNLYAPKLKKLQIPHYPFVKALDINGTNLESLFPERKAIKGKIDKLTFDIINVFILRGPEYYDDILNIQKEFKFDLMVCDCAFTGLPFVTDLMKIPVVSIGVFPLTESSKDLAPNGFGMTPSYTFGGKIKQNLLRFMSDKIVFRKPNQALAKLMKEYGISYNNETVFDFLVKKSTLLLQSGTPNFEYKRSDMGANIRFIGALLPHTALSNQQPWFDERLNRYEKIVLITQGTVEKDVEKLVVPTLEAFKGTDTLVVATTGGSQTGELRERFPQSNIIIEDFIPFADVMPYADVYITNGGYGGVMLSIQNGLPMVVAGVHEGKNEINARIGYFKLGVNLKTELPAPQQIRAGVEEVIRNGIYREQVALLAEDFSNYDPASLAAHHIEETLKQKAILQIN